MEQERTYGPGELERLRKTEMEIYREFARVCDAHGLRFCGTFGTALGAVRHGGYIPWDDDMDISMPRADYERLIELARGGVFSAPYELLEPRFTDGYVLNFAKLTRADSTFVEATDTDRTYHSGIFIDIFPLDTVPRQKRRRYRVYRRAFVLAKLLVLTEYGRPKLPKGLHPAVRAVLRAAFLAAHGLLRLTGQTSRKMYGRYLAAAQSCADEDTGVLADLIMYRQESNHWLPDPLYPEKMLFPARDTAFEDAMMRVPAAPRAYLARTFGDTWNQLPPEEDRHTHAPAVLVFPPEETA